MDNRLQSVRRAVAALPSPGYELLLLPLFAQFVNLNLSLLRDGVLFGAGWGWNQFYQQMISSKLTKSINDFLYYANDQYQQYRNDLINGTKNNNHKCERFRTVNAYEREMTFSVIDYMQFWPYFDPSTYPDPVSVYLAREIYSDPVGTCDDSGPIQLPTWATQPISEFSVWAWDRIDAVQVTYPSGGGRTASPRPPGWAIKAAVAMRPRMAASSRSAAITR